MKKQARQIIAILCVLAMSVALFAGCNNEPEYSVYSVIEEQVVEVEGEQQNNTDATSKEEDAKDNNSNATGTTSKDNAQTNNSGDKAQTNTDSKASTPTDTVSTSDSSKDTGNEKVNPADYKGKTVVYATWERSEGVDTKAVKNKFKQKYGITLQYKTVVQSNYLQEVLAMVNSGNSPDVIKDCDFWPGFIQIAQPLENAKIDLESGIWDKEHLKQSTVNGKTYSLASTSFGQNLTVCYYNKKLLQNAGIRAPEEYQKMGSWNFDAFEKIMTEVKSKLGTGYYGGWLERGNSSLYSCFGTDTFIYKDGKFTNGTSSKTYSEISKYIAKWSKEGYLAGSREQFADGKVGVAISSDYGLRKTGHWRSANWKDIGFIELPSLGSKKANMAGNWQGYGICKGAEQPVAGGIFLTWYLNENNHDITSYYISEEAYNYRAKQMANLKNKFVSTTVSPFTCIGLNHQLYENQIYATDPAQIDTLLKQLQPQVNSYTKKIQKFYDDAVEAEKKAY